VNEAELRALIRDAVARHLGDADDRTRPSLPPAHAAPPAAAPAAPTAAHPSQAIYVTLTSGGDACLIEPAVPCSRCGYCKTHGY
jgi:hypothetical protein